MKHFTTYILVGLATIIFGLVLGPYFYVFSGPLSRDYAQWAAFGTYIGGVVTPLALLATLAALVQNEKHRDREMRRLSNESIKTDLVRQIEKIESDIMAELDRIDLTINIKGEPHKFPGRDILFRLSLIEWRKLIPSSEEVNQAIDESDDGVDRLDRRVLAYEVFGICAGNINRLREYAIEHEKVAGHNAEALYLKWKYRTAVERLSERDFHVRSWNDVARQLDYADQASTNK